MDNNLDLENILEVVLELTKTAGEVSDFKHYIFKFLRVFLGYR